MAIGIKYGSGGGGDILPIVKYNAKAGIFNRIDRIQNSAGSWDTEEVDITAGFKAVFDMENIEVGWMNFDTGGAPDFRLVSIGEDPGPSPGEKYRSGFRIMLKLAPACGGDHPVREFSSVAGVCVGAFDALHDAYLAGMAEHHGQLPVVVASGKRGVKSQYGTNFEPVFEIAQWVARPNDLVFKPKARADLVCKPKARATNGNRQDSSGVVQNSVASNGPPATGSKQVSAPTTDKDFG